MSFWEFKALWLLVENEATKNVILSLLREHRELVSRVIFEVVGSENLSFEKFREFSD